MGPFSNLVGLVRLGNVQSTKSNTAGESLNVRRDTDVNVMSGETIPGRACEDGFASELARLPRPYPLASESLNVIYDTDAMQ